MAEKRERQYEHIKDSAKKQGKSTKRAKEIAARTVNKERSQKGETKGSGGKTTKSPSSRRKSSSSKSSSSRKSSGKNSSGKKSSRSR